MAAERTKQAGEGERGQVAVSLVAVVPALILLTLVLVQFALAGHAAFSAANAARAAARATYVGADATDAALAALPGALREGARVSTGGDEAEVELRAPRALPFLPTIPVSASAALGPDDGAPGG